MALIEDPEKASLVAAIVLMGGDLGLDPRYGCTNTRPVAECEMWFDPAARRTALGSGIPLTMVSLDVTDRNKSVVLTDEAPQVTFESFSPSVPAADLSNSLASWRNMWTDGGELAIHARQHLAVQPANAARAA